MSSGGPSGFRDLATGFLSGFAALATAVAGVVGVLHETGYLGSRTSASPAVVATSSTLTQPAPSSSAGLAANALVPTLPAFPGERAHRAPNDILKIAPNQAHRRPRPHRVVASSDAEAAIAPRNAADQIDPHRPAPQSISSPYAVAAIAPGSGAPAVAPPREISPSEPAKSEQPMAMLTGAWRDSGPGFCHVIKQDGDSFEIVNFAPVTNTYISVGHGTVSGRGIHLHLNDLHPAAAKGELYISDDGQKLLGTMTRPDGEHPLVWHRSGGACG
jgi:hypothetical protein